MTVERFYSSLPPTPGGSASSFHIQLLKAELENRKRKNPRYSLRAFARSLKMDPAALSRILSGKQPLSPRACPQILCELKTSPDDREMFLESILAERNAGHYQRVLGNPDPLRNHLADPADATSSRAESVPAQPSLRKSIRIDSRRTPEAQLLIQRFLDVLEKQMEATPGASAVDLRIEATASAHSFD